MENVKQLRKKIDDVDEQILCFLSERAKICELMSSVKKDHGIPIKDAYRENEVYAHVKEKAAELALDPVLVKSIYRQIINMCNAVQESKEKGEC